MSAQLENILAVGDSISAWQFVIMKLQWRML